MIELELTDYQTFITAKARENYFNSVKQYYDCVRFTDENHQYQLYLYTKKYDSAEYWTKPTPLGTEIIRGLCNE